jgi:glycosyltransferase involved in cell wall biosynthesis
MRIAVNTRLLVPRKMDGIARFTFESLKLISEKHSEHTFDFIFDRTPPKAFKFPPNVSLHKISPPARHPLLWLIWFEIRLKQFVNKGNYDLFLSPEGWIPPNLNCPSLGVIHDLNFVHHPENIIASHRKYLQNYFPKFAKRASRIATVSEFSKRDICQTYQIKETSIDVVYNGALDSFKPISEEEKRQIQATFSEGCPYFIFIGTLHPRKNLEHLFKAFETFKKTDKVNTKLLIVGNRKWWPTELEQLYQKMSAKDSVVFCGRQSDQQLSKLLAAADCLTYLPYFEGFGIPILEAFQSGTAVITSKVSSMPEIAKDAALLCNPKNKEEIAIAMKQIMEKPKLRRDLIEKGLKRAQDFSWEKTADLLWNSMLKTTQGGKA